MSQHETLMARDGHNFTTYIAKPAAAVRGAVVIVQEIFGLTPFITRTCDQYAADGYLAIAPALFDRIRRNLVLGYTQAEVEQAMGYRKQIENDKAVLDINAAAAVVGHAGRVAVIGFCWGGLLAWLSAARQPIGAAVSYYGARISENLEKLPSCPVMLHYGEQDKSIPPDEIERVHQAFPQGHINLYAAGHAFANDDRPSNYNAEAATLARSRTAAFLAQHIG